MKLNLGDNTRTHRRAMDMTQEQLAEQLGVSFQSVSRWENGTTYPDMELLPALARMFSVTVDALLGMSDDERRIQFEAVCETLKKELQEGNHDNAIKNMSPSDSQKFQQALANPKIIEKMMSAPQAQALYRKLTGEK